MSELNYTQEDWDRGAVEIAPSRFVVSDALLAKLKGTPIDPESFVPVSEREHALSHAIKGDTEFATDDKHGPLHGPIITFIAKNAKRGLRMAVPHLGECWVALRAVIPRRNLVVWAYPKEAEGTLRSYHADGTLH